MIPATELNDDWLRAGRLRERAEQGVGEAKRELQEMDTSFYSYTEIDGA